MIFNWRRLRIGAAIAVMVAAIAAGGCGTEPPPVDQPMAFSHRSHAAEDMECVDCHQGAEKAAAAGFPGIAGCMLCHDEAKGKHPDEPKVREIDEAGGEIPWVRVNGNVGHVYFSHVAHVAFAEMKCEECHGDMENRVEPVRRRKPELHSMDRCMACHEERGANNDCLGCHQ